jgi:hypothetical protein
VFGSWGNLMPGPLVVDELWTGLDEQPDRAGQLLLSLQDSSPPSST